jgi:outer membrane protein assembly factor BamC
MIAFRPLPLLLALSSALALTACSTVDSVLGDKVDYRGQSQKNVDLEVPPDLTPLQRDGRYKPQRGAPVSANELSQLSAAQAKDEASPLIAPAQVKGAQVMRDGRQRWLVVNQTPEQLWPQVRDFWLDNGFTLTVDNATAGVLETDWQENRAKLPQDMISRALGKLIDGVRDSGFRDRFRTRIERVGDQTEIYISHRGIEQKANGGLSDGFRWESIPNDPQIEAEFLTRLMVRLGSREEVARKAIEEAGTPSAAAQPKAPQASSSSSAKKVVDLPAGVQIQNNTLVIDDGFDRSWRRIGLALDRIGFTVEDRDRSAGMYFLRWQDPKGAGQEEPNFMVRLFRGDDRLRFPKNLRLQVESQGARTVARLLDSTGKPVAAELANAFIQQLGPEMR